VTIILARTPVEAQERGWPCVGEHLAVLRRVVERAPASIRIVPVYAGEDRAGDLATARRGQAAR